jgi:hypothetical protein
MAIYNYLDIGFDNLLTKGVSFPTSGLPGMPETTLPTGGSYNAVTDLVETPIMPNDLLSGQYTENLEIGPRGLIRGGATDWEVGTGFWLGYYSSTKTYNLFVGDATGNNLTWDGSVLTIQGILVASEIHIPDQDTTDNSFHVNSDGDTWWGATETDFNADNDNAEAYVLKDGTAKFTNIKSSPSVGIALFDAGTITTGPNWAMTNNGRYIFSIETGGSGDMFLYDSGAEFVWIYPRSATSSLSPSIEPACLTQVRDAGVEYLLGVASGGTAVKRYDDDGTNETAVTVSGTSLTGIYRVGYSQADAVVYAQDGASADSTSIKRFTFAGSTLTYVDTITLSAAPTTGGSPCLIWIGQTNLAIVESYPNNSSAVFKRYDKDTGVATTDITLGVGTTGFGCVGVATRSTDGNLLFMTEQDGNANTTSLILDYGFIMDN